MKLLAPAQAAAALRDELLTRGWPTSEEVGRANHSHAANPARWAKTKRDRGELLGVWSATDRTYRHPSFQFYADGTLRPRTRELLLALAEIPDFAPSADPGGWRRAFWLHGSSYALAGADGQPRAAADVFLEDPESVLQSVREEASQDPNSSWVEFHPKLSHFTG